MFIVGRLLVNVLIRYDIILDLLREIVSVARLNLNHERVRPMSISWLCRACLKYDMCEWFVNSLMCMLFWIFLIAALVLRSITIALFHITDAGKMREFVVLRLIHSDEEAPSLAKRSAWSLK